MSSRRFQLGIHQFNLQCLPRSSGFFSCRNSSGGMELKTTYCNSSNCTPSELTLKATLFPYCVYAFHVSGTARGKGLITFNTHVR